VWRLSSVTDQLGEKAMRIRLAALLAVILVAGSFAGAQAPSRGRLLVLSKGDLTLAVVDPATLTVVGKVPSGPDPHEVAASADGRTAYITNYGAGRGGLNTLTVGDLVSFKPLPPVDLGPIRGPHGIVEAGGKVYFTAEVNKVIGRYDPAARKLDWVIGTGRDISHMVVVSKDLKRLFTVDVQSATASIIEQAVGRAGRFAPAADDDWTVTSIKVGEPTDDFEGFDVAPNGRELWAASPRGKLTIVDTIGKKVVQTLEIPDISGANRVKFTPDGRLVLVSRLGGGGGRGRGAQPQPAAAPANIVVFDAASRKIVKGIDAGGGVGGILVQPDGARAYGSSSQGVVVIDLKTLAVVGRVDVGPRPDGLAWAAKP
jgi:DNA-binding beta-propeller fold protein YncE